MSDLMLSELYKRAYQQKTILEAMDRSDEPNDRQRQVALALSRLLSELIDYRTDLIRTEN